MTQTTRKIEVIESSEQFETDDQIFFENDDWRSHSNLHVVLNYASGQWRLFDSVYFDSAYIEAVTLGRKLVRLRLDGTFELVEDSVSRRRPKRRLK